METALVEGLKAGSQHAWEQLIDRYGGLVRRRVAEVVAAFGRPGDWSTVDDVTAEVFATLLARDAAAIRCFRWQSRFSTYLAVIATRVARRALARIVRQTACQQQHVDRLETLEATAAQDAESRLIGREELEQLLSLVDRLPRKQKQLVIAFYREEQTYAEISQRFDIPIGSIGTTLRRAEQKLRQWIEDVSQ